MTAISVELPIELSVAAPAYNEADAIEATIRSWHAWLASSPGISSFQIVVCNDGSADRTGEICDALANELFELVVVRHPMNRGAAAALRSAIAATNKPWVLLIDSDGQFPIENLAPMLDALVEHGGPGVMGARDKQGSSAERLGSQVSGALCNAIYGTAYQDFNSALKLVDGPVLRSLRLEARGLNYSTEITARLAEAGMKLTEVPIRHEQRTGGTSSMRLVHDGLARVGFVTYLGLRRLLVANKVIDGTVVDGARS